jgi:hypothetical protein
MPTSSDVGSSERKTASLLPADARRALLAGHQQLIVTIYSSVFTFTSASSVPLRFKGFDFPSSV